MKTNAYIFIFTAVIYNLIDLGNDRYNFINGKFLDDVWYVLMYAHLSYMFYIVKNQTFRNTYLKVAFWVSIARLVYNVGIMTNQIEYEKYQSSFFVPFFALLLLTLDLVKEKWRLSALKLAFGFTTLLLLFFWLLWIFRKW